MAAAEGVEAGVLMEEAGKEEGGEVGAVGLVDEAAPGVGVETGDSLAEGGVLVEAFGGDGGEAEEEEGGVVECLVGGDVEVVLPAGGRGAGTCGDGAEVGHEAEDAGGFLAVKRDGISLSVLGDGVDGLPGRVAVGDGHAVVGGCGVGGGIIGRRDAEAGWIGERRRRRRNCESRRGGDEDGVNS